MIRNVCLIPARSGSKGVPNKNFRKFSKTNLTEIAVNLATKIFESTDIVLSSDHPHAKELAKNYGINFHNRPKHLATDVARISLLVSELIELYKLDLLDRMIILEPSSPFRTKQDINTGLRFLSDISTRSVTSVSRPTVGSKKILTTSNGVLKALGSDTYQDGNRQELPPEFYSDGVFYGFEIGAFLDKSKIPIEGSKYFETVHFVLDINSQYDFDLAEIAYSATKLSPESP